MSTQQTLKELITNLRIEDNWNDIAYKDIFNNYLDKF